ncbi:MAG: transporter [Azonexus sp.]|jgi:plastocyanin|nr:transporter [Azonexus sp.]
MPFSFHRLKPGLLGFLAALASAPALADEVNNNPGHDRPGLGFSPAVLQAGDFSLEQGLPGWSRSGGVSTYSADTLLRLGLGHALEAQFSTGWNRVRDAGVTTDGRYGTALALKFAQSVDNISWGLLGSVQFTDGDKAFRAEQTTYALGTTVSWQRTDHHAIGIHAAATHGATDDQLLAVNTSYALSDTVGVYVEAAGQHLGGIGNGSMAGGGFTWQVTPRVQLDIGFRHRLGGHADTWQGGAGFAIYFGD